MSGICIVATALDGALARSSLELVGGGRALGASLGLEVGAILLGYGPGLPEATGILQQYGTGTVHRITHPTLTAGQTDACLIAVEQVVRATQPQIVLISADTVGRELAPRLAHRTGAALATECVELAAEGQAVVAKRQVYGGRALATLVVTRRPAVLSVKPRALEAPEPAPASGTVTDVAVIIDAAALPTRVREVQREQAELAVRGGPPRAMRLYQQYIFLFLNKREFCL